MAKRKKGNGTIRKRSDGRWEGRHVIGYDEKGLPKTKSVLAKTKAECVAKLKVLQESSQAPTLKTQKSDMKFGDWIHFWYENFCKPNIRPSTQNDYENRIYKHIIPQIGNLALNQITTAKLQQFYGVVKESGRKRMADYYGEGLSDRMVNGCHSTCKKALDKAVELKLIRQNPAVGCRVPSAKAKEMQVLSSEELQRLLIQARYDGYFHLILLEIATGLRRGEILALQWEDVNFATGELHISKQVNRLKGKLTISQPKTKAANRIIILPTAVLQELKSLKEQSDSKWLFPSTVVENMPLDPASCRKKLQQILDHAGCKRVRFHDLRHSFATNAIANGMDVKTLSTIIGHVSAATTLDIYTHSTQAMQEAAAQNIDRGICGVALIPTTQKAKKPSPPQKFEPYQGNIRKKGTGCISQIGENLWEGRYSPRLPNGKRWSKNIYGKTQMECEEKLSRLIVDMKAEILEQKRSKIASQ